MNSLPLAFIRFYKKFLSPLLPRACRFHPSCSEYSYQAYQEYGFWKATWLTLKRISRCNPFFEGYFDPLPRNNTKKQR